MGPLCLGLRGSHTSFSPACAPCLSSHEDPETQFVTQKKVVGPHSVKGPDILSPYAMISGPHCKNGHLREVMMGYLKCGENLLSGRGNSHLSLASSHGNGGLSCKLSTSEHFHPPNFSPWALRKSRGPREGTHTCVSSEGQGVEAQTHTALWEGLR